MNNIRKNTKKKVTSLFFILLTILLILKHFRHTLAKVSEEIIDVNSNTRIGLSLGSCTCLSPHMHNLPRGVNYRWKYGRSFYDNSSLKQFLVCDNRIGNEWGVGVLSRMSLRVNTTTRYEHIDVETGRHPFIVY